MEPLTRKYTMSNAALAQLVSDFIVFMSRDATEFAARGVDGGSITAFEALGNAFEVFPTDEEYLGLVMIEVDAKDALRETCTAHVQLISGYFEQQWGLKSGQYKRLGISSLLNLKDKNFLLRCREVVRIATEYLTDLTAAGLTQTMIDNLEADAQSFEDKLNAIADKSALRDEKTQERTEKGNELYSYIKEYATIGKLIWENVSEAKYNDYVIYRRKPGVPGKVDNFAYDVPTMTAYWDTEPLAQTYKLEYKQNVSDGVWEDAFSGPTTSTVYNPGEGNWVFRVRAENVKGPGEWSDELEVEIAPE